MFDDYKNMFLKKTEAEKFFSVSKSQLSKWIRQGGVGDMRGYVNVYDLFCFWRDNIHGVEKLEANKDEKDDAPLAEIKRKIQIEILEAKKLENKKEKGKLVLKEDVLDAWVSRLSDLRGGLLSLSRRLSKKIIGKNEIEARDLIQLEVDNLFINFSKEGRFCNTSASKEQ